MVDLVNKKFGRLTVIRKTAKRDKWQNVYWLCRCDCGVEKKILGRNLIRGYTKSCGCLAKHDYKNKKFGKLLVLCELKERDKYSRVMWLCLCDCGNKRKASTGDLTGGFAKSCGCLKPIPNMTICAFCGKKIQRRPSHIYDKSFCDKSCHSNWQSENMYGENHPNWMGGISQQPYCPSWGQRRFKESIKIRDSYKCQNPDCWNTDSQLCIHHIDYDKMNCDKSNLITLCRSCNARANKNRNSHKVFYQNIVNQRGGIYA